MLNGTVIMKKQTLSALELKQILFDIKDNGPQICVRFRLLGEMWQNNMVKVVNITESRILVNDEIKNKLIAIDLNRVMQFELDHKFKGLDPHFHYDITPYNFTQTNDK
jgi:CO dehydrogenase/acetyl-CoA synthase epsilon subunit